MRLINKGVLRNLVLAHDSGRDALMSDCGTFRGLCNVVSKMSPRTFLKLEKSPNLHNFYHFPEYLRCPKRIGAVRSNVPTLLNPPFEIRRGFKSDPKLTQFVYRPSIFRSISVDRLSIFELNADDNVRLAVPDGRIQELRFIK
jgi:hypothetical protein